MTYEQKVKYQRTVVERCLTGTILDLYFDRLPFYSISRCKGGGQQDGPLIPYFASLPRKTLDLQPVCDRISTLVICDPSPPPHAPDFPTDNPRHEWWTHYPGKHGVWRHSVLCG